MAANFELFDCSICLQLLEDPVTTACGHSYCVKCINTFWDKNNNGGRVYSCPQCRQSFQHRPALKRNTLLADVLEEHRKKSNKNADNDGDDNDVDSYAVPGDVPCDACVGRKKKATMFCFMCLVSYCETHLKPHYEIPPLRKHKLVPASQRIKESICLHHDKLLEVYCRTDQHFVCLLCVLDQHKGHDTIAVAPEMCEMQKQLEKQKQEVMHRVMNSEKKIAELKNAADSLRGGLWETLDDFEQMCLEHIRSYIQSVERKRTEMRQKAGETEKAGIDWINSQLDQLRREVSELRRRNDQLDQISHMEDPIQFFQSFHSLADFPVLTAAPESHNTLTKFVATQKDKLKTMCNKEKYELINVLEKNMLSMIPVMYEKKSSRPYVLAKMTKLEVDPNTIAACLYLSSRNREMSWGSSDQAHPDHPHRFTFFHQALCKDGLTGDHYWEVEWDGGIVEVAVSYKGINRKGSGRDCCFGHNKLSWKLVCFPSGCTFWHNNLYKANIPPVHSRRVGVHLSSREGILCFYSVSDSAVLTCLHQIQTRFTEPLYPGFCVDLGATLRICKF